MIEPTLELLDTLKWAQLKHASEYINYAIKDGGYSDDGYDYLQAALGLARELVVMEYDQDLARFGRLLNDTDDLSGDGLQNYASDGICNEIWELKPPSLQYLLD